MTSLPSGLPKNVSVAEMPIELCQFLKFAGLSASGGEAKQAVSLGQVHVNGLPESRKRRKLVRGDRVTFAGQTLVVSA
jgi:ribosome-associated protein